MPSPSPKTATTSLSPKPPVSPSNIHVKLVGRGVQGVVYRVQFGRGKPFAVKFALTGEANEALEVEDAILQELQKAPAECRKYFLKRVPKPRDPKTRQNMEVKIYRDIHRRGIRVGSFHGRLNMVLYMEYLDHAVTLTQIVDAIRDLNRNKTISVKPELAYFLQPPVLKSILDQVPKAFLCLFKQGWLHKDAHLGNIMIVRNVSNNNATKEPVSVKLVDFGMAQGTNTRLSPHTTLKNMDRIREWYHASVLDSYSWPNLTLVNGTYTKGKLYNGVKREYNRIKNFAAKSPSKSKSPKTNRSRNAY
jgi:serine/threonine protein kinase